MTPELEILYSKLGIDPEPIKARQLPFHAEAPELVDAGQDICQRPLKLTAQCCQAWWVMQAAANSDNIELKAVSGFRSYQYQADLIERKLEQGRNINEILQIIAPPGYSEHHSGCAIDICSPEQNPLEDAFRETAAYEWLSTYAGDFGFTESYPLDNPYGFIAEPWHWCFHEAGG